MCFKSIKNGLITLFCLSLSLFLPVCFPLPNVQKAFSLRGSRGFFCMCSVYCEGRGTCQGYQTALKQWGISLVVCLQGWLSSEYRASSG